MFPNRRRGGGARGSVRRLNDEIEGAGRRGEATDDARGQQIEPGGQLAAQHLKGDARKGGAAGSGEFRLQQNVLASDQIRSRLGQTGVG